MYRNRRRSSAPAGLSPAIAAFTRGKYYIARENVHFPSTKAEGIVDCCICEHQYEPQDMAFCPVYDGAICSLCCTLDARCHDACKTKAPRRSRRAGSAIGALFSDKLAPKLSRRLLRVLGVSLAVGSAVAALFWLFYHLTVTEIPASFQPALLSTFVKLWSDASEAPRDS